MNKGIPGARNVDHVAYTVPNLEEAVSFFVDVLGAELVYRAGPVEDKTGDWMSKKLNVHPRTSANIAMLRLGPVTNVELFEFRAPDQNRSMPKNSDYGGHHLAFYVDDVDAAATYLQQQPGVRVLGEPETIEVGPIAGNRWVYFLTPWGMQMEILNMPPGMPYERQSRACRFGPSEAWTNR